MKKIFGVLVAATLLLSGATAQNIPGGGNPQVPNSGGAGGYSASATTALTGVNAFGFAAGGSGGAVNSFATTAGGGTGSPGYVLITEYTNQ